MDAGPMMEQEILKYKVESGGDPLFHRIDYNRKKDVTRLHFVAGSEQEAYKYADTTFKSMYAETARINRQDVDPATNVFPRFLHYEYSLDAKLRTAPSNLLPRRATRQQGSPTKGIPKGQGYVSPKGQGYGSPKGQGKGYNQQASPMPTAYGIESPGGRPNPWHNAKKPWNNEASTGTTATAATLTMDIDEIKRLIEESVQEQLSKRDKELDEMRMQMVIRTEIESLQLAYKRLESKAEALESKMDASTLAILQVIQQKPTGTTAASQASSASPAVESNGIPTEASGEPAAMETEATKTQGEEGKPTALNTIEAAINEDPPTEPTLPADNPDVPLQQPPIEPTQTPPPTKACISRPSKDRSEQEESLSNHKYNV